MTRRRARGMTLLEIIVAATILLMVVAVVGTVILQGMALTRRGEEFAKTNDAATFSAETIIHALRAAGMGAPMGVRASINGVPAGRFNAVIGGDAAYGATDDIWIVVPDAAAMGPGCTTDANGNTRLSTSAPAAMAMMLTGGAGPIQVRTRFVDNSCQPNWSSYALPMASNMVTGVLLVGATFTAGAAATDPFTLNYTGSGTAALTTAPERGGFSPGDVVFPVTLQHFFVSNGALYREYGTTSAAVAAPFVGLAATRTLVSRNIEDLQFAYGSRLLTDSSPGVTSWANSWPAAFNDKRALLSVRVTVVAKSERVQLNSQVDTTPNFVRDPDLAPMSAENNTPAPVMDGFRRTRFSRRVELPNMSAGSL